MINQSIKPILFLAFSLSAMGCQVQPTTQVIENETNTDIVETKPLPVPCKNFSAPQIKDKNKIKDMLIKEGKLNDAMTNEEIDLYVNNFIKKKSQMACKASM